MVTIIFDLQSYHRPGATATEAAATEAAATRTSTEAASEGAARCAIGTVGRHSIKVAVGAVAPETTVVPYRI